MCLGGKITFGKNKTAGLQNLRSGFDCTVNTLAMIEMSVSRWNKNYDKCRSCKTILFNHKGKGLCTRCYPIFNRIEMVKKWKTKESITTIQGFDEKDIYEALDYNIPVSDLKKRVIDCLNSQLFWLRHYGSVENKSYQIDALKLENLLNSIAKCSRCYKSDLFNNDASHIGAMLSKDDQKFIYLRLLKILIYRKGYFNPLSLEFVSTYIRRNHK